MHILFCTEYLPPYISGISNRCKNLINGYRGRGHKVTVCSVENTDCDIVAPSVSNPFYAEQRVFAFPPIVLLLQLLDFTKPLPYDVCHFVSPLCFAMIWLIPLFKLRGAKIYVSYHVLLEYYFVRYFGSNRTFFTICEALFVSLYYLPLVFLADCVGIPSKTADNYVFKYSKQIHYLKSGLDTSVFKPADQVVKPEKSDYKKILSIAKESDFYIKNIRDIAGPNGILMTYIGRLAPEKDIEFLISSLGDPRLKDARLCIVGDGPIRADLEKLAKSVVGNDQVYTGPTVLGNDSGFFDSEDEFKRVIFTGMILDEHQVASYYAQSDVFVSASGSETFGFTVAEAMACSTPAVMVRSGAFKTVYKAVDDWMFEPGNDSDFVSKVLLATSSPTNRLRARKIAVEGFGVDRAVVDLLQAYQKIIDGVDI